MNTALTREPAVLFHARGEKCGLGAVFTPTQAVENVSGGDYDFLTSPLDRENFMARMTKFTIERFRQFSQAMTVDLDPVTILIGANNSGKTSILQAISLFQYCMERCLTRNGKNGGASHWHLKKSDNVPPEEFGPLPVSTPTELWPDGKPKDSISLTAEFAAGGTISFEIKLQYNLFNIKPTVTDVADLDGLLDSFAIRMIPVFSGLLTREEFLVLPARDERQRAQRYGEIVRNLLFSLKKDAPDRFELLGQLLSRLYPDAGIDVNYDEEVARRIASARIESAYHDDNLQKSLDLIVAGSGLHQAVQIFAGLLQPGISMVLLDEPDAHFHARLQGGLMRILTDLVKALNLQFVIATHSPQLVRTAPSGSLRVCRRGVVVPFSPGPDQLELLDHLGVMERMELIPLLQSRRVVFVENREDRQIIELFVRKRLGMRAEQTLNGLTFLYTYQEPVSARVLEKARQVNDILKNPDLAALGFTGEVTFIAIGDRDYRTDAETHSEEREHREKAKQHSFGFPFELRLWRRTEIENYLLDIEAFCSAVRNAADLPSKLAIWSNVEAKFRQTFSDEMAKQKDAVIERFANRLQDRDRRLQLPTAMQKARDVLHGEWGDGRNWCDAKVVLAAMRRFLQSNKLPEHALSHKNIIEAMTSLPDDIEKLAKRLSTMVKTDSASGPKRRKTKASGQ